MSTRMFRELLGAQWSRDKFFYVGLDSRYEQIPACVRTDDVESTIVEFNRRIVEATSDIVCAYKLNLAYYLEQGAEGILALQRTFIDIRAIAPDVPAILDIKCADIENTNFGWSKFAFEYLGADAVTVNPFLGHEPLLEPFLKRADKGIFVVCRTSNPGAKEFQDLNVHNDSTAYERKFYESIAMRVVDVWSANDNCGLVVGATCPDEIEKVRFIVKAGIPILIPGAGAQGGDLEKAVRVGRNNAGSGFVIGSSRSVIFASPEADFAEAARKKALELNDTTNRYRKEAATP